MELSFDVWLASLSKLSQFMHDPRDVHWKAAKRLLRYLHQTSTYGLKLSKDIDKRLVAYSDSDWAWDLVDCTSTTDYVIYFEKAQISWSFKKQRVVSWFFTEAECRTVASTAAKVKWIVNLLHELRVSTTIIPQIMYDNLTTTYVCHNLVLHNKMKYVAIDFHFVKEYVQNKEIEVHHYTLLIRLLIF